MVEVLYSITLIYPLFRNFIFMLDVKKEKVAIMNKKQKNYYMLFCIQKMLSKFCINSLEHFIKHKRYYFWRMLYYIYIPPLSIEQAQAGWHFLEVQGSLLNTWLKKKLELEEFKLKRLNKFRKLKQVRRPAVPTIWQQLQKKSPVYFVNSYYIQIRILPGLPVSYKYKVSTCVSKNNESYYWPLKSRHTWDNISYRSILEVEASRQKYKTLLILLKN